MVFKEGLCPPTLELAWGCLCGKLACGCLHGSWPGGVSLWSWPGVSSWELDWGYLMGTGLGVSHGNWPRVVSLGALLWVSSWKMAWGYLPAELHIYPFTEGKAQLQSFRAGRWPESNCPALSSDLNVSPATEIVRANTRPPF